MDIFQDPLTVPADLDESIHNVDNISRTLMIESSVKNIDQQLKHRCAEHIFEVYGVHGEIAQN